MTLDDIDEIKKIDSLNMVGSIELVGKQIEQTWNEIEKITVPSIYKSVKNIVFSGMGGSSLGAYVFKYLYASSISVPFEVINDYNLPLYVDSNSLVIVGSYSGTTEETLSCYKQAKEKGARIIAIAAGGKLEEWAIEDKNPFYKIEPQFNPCNQPRMGIGYSIFGILTFLTKLEIINISSDDLSELYSALEENNKLYGINIPESDNLAKKIARSLFEKLPIFIAGEFLIGSIHAVRNQLNENAKSIAVYFPLPELDHHLLEALSFPLSIKKDDRYILFNSSCYSEKISKRLQITANVLSESGHNVQIVDFKSGSKLTQTIQAINFGSYVGYYLSLCYETDPSPIPNVESFKKKLAS